MSSRMLAVALMLAACSEVSVLTTPKTPVEEPPADAAPPGNPDILVEPPALTFGIRPVDCPSPPQTVTFTNVGDAPLNIKDIVEFGTGVQAFTVTGLRRIQLQPGEAHQVEVVFTPFDEAPFEDVQLRVVSNDPDEPEVFTPLKGSGGDGVYAEELYVQGSLRDADILWVLDTSTSLDSERKRVINSISKFITAFVNLGIDYRIGLTTTDMSTGGAQGRLLGPWIDASNGDPAGAFRTQANSPLAGDNCDTGGNCGSSQEMGFDASHAALATRANTPPNQGFVRSDATLAVVVLTDEDDSSSGRFPAGAFGPNLGTANDYVTWLRTQKTNPDDVSFSAMSGPDGAFRPTANACGGGLLANPSASYAPRYHTAIKATRGAWANICTFDIDPFLNQLAFVAAGLEYSFPLTGTPADDNPLSFEVTVDGQPVPWGSPDGYTYDPDTNSIVLWGVWLPAPGATIVVQYKVGDTCDTAP